MDNYCELQGKINHKNNKENSIFKVFKKVSYDIILGKIREKDR
jgi:hypothetical protein